MNNSLFFRFSGISLILALGASVSSCDKDNISDEVIVNKNVVTGKEAAIENALLATNTLFGNQQERQIESVNILNETGNDTLAYVCNFKDNAGFAVVTIDENKNSKVIACSDEGRYNEKTTNPGLSLIMGNLMACAENKKNEAQEGTSLKSANALKQLIKDSSKMKGPLVKTAWDQGYPYNALYDTCPSTGYNYYTGCTATAIVQLVAYHNRPGFADMAHLTSKRSANQLDEYGKLWVAILFKSFRRDVEPAVERCEGTGTYVEDGMDYLEDYGYRTSKMGGFPVDRVISNIDNGNPVIVSGQGPNNASHTWIVDGYYKEEGDTYFHINWGWGGDCDGWFSSGCFDVDAAKEYDQRHYKYNRKYTYSILTYEAYPTNKN